MSNISGKKGLPVDQVETSLKKRFYCFFQVVLDTLASVEVPHEVERETKAISAPPFMVFVYKHGMHVFCCHAYKTSCYGNQNWS